MDMYHGGHRELRSVPGFSALAELPARAARGCPPQVVPDTDSSARYVFDNLEVAVPAHLPGGAPEEFQVGVSGSAFVEFIVDTTGRVEEQSIVVRHVEREELRPHVARAVRSLRFVPAEHHPGCKVRMRTGGPLEFK
jgi:TonB family protein